MISSGLILPEPVPIASGQRDFWILPCPAVALGTGVINGKGTIDYPFYGDFGAIINSLPPAVTIRLFTGTYGCRCDGTVWLKDSQNVIGSGWGTVLQRDPRDAWAANNQPVLLGRGDNISIGNLTLDANAPENNPDGSPASNYAYSGLRIEGKSPRVTNARVIRPTGNRHVSVPQSDGTIVYVGQECWAMFFQTGEDQPRAIVSDCLVTDVRGDYVEGFAFLGAGTFFNCRAEFPVLASQDGPIFNGFQGSGNVRVLDCTQNGGKGFFYTDTESSSPKISRGLLTNGIQAVWISVNVGQTLDGLEVDGCRFELLPNIAGTRYGVAVGGPAGGGPKRNVRVISNMFRYAPGTIDPNIVGAKFAASVDGGDHTVFLNNVVDPDFGFYSESGGASEGTVYAARATAATP